VIDILLYGLIMGIRIGRMFERQDAARREQSRKSPAKPV